MRKKFEMTDPGFAFFSKQTNNRDSCSGKIFNDQQAIFNIQ